ncbi:MAG: cobyric acid synthase [Eubacteriales bacterium]|nr:cobyric acid synthase [Eubacteriales bacterium]
MAKVIMVQGTMSNAGKSFLVAGLCRIFKQDGYRVAPFKSQNMALNSFITEEGLEMGRAQVMQAEAAGLAPKVCMNPILLKPTSDMGSQVIVNGEVIGNMKARDYFAYKKELIPDIKKAFRTLADQVDIIVIEGAGSPAEINLKENDIVNMGMAKMVDAPVLLVGDIDRGGVFAQLLGTIMLLDEDEKERVKGLVINKFRGDKTILDPGIDMLEEKGLIPVTGVLPYMDVRLEDEDSLTTRFDQKQIADIDIAVVRYPRISNFTDLDVFEQMEGVSVRYITSVRELGKPDMIVLPGSKNTIGDLLWMRENGLEAAIHKLKKDCVIFGICGGYQMLGKKLCDPIGVEHEGDNASRELIGQQEKKIYRGMGFLNMDTVIQEEKLRRQVKGHFQHVCGVLECLSGKEYEGYELHMGKTTGQQVQSLLTVEQDKTTYSYDGAQTNHIYGTYVHGIFDKGNIANEIVAALASKKGIDWTAKGNSDYKTFKETQYDKLADIVRAHMDMEAVYEMLREAKV